MLTYGVSRLQALAFYVGVKEAKSFPFMFDMIIVPVYARGKIQPIDSAQGKSLACVAAFMITDLIMLIYKGISSKPASKTF